MKSSIPSSILGLLYIPAFAATLMAEPLAFDFKDPKGVNNAQFQLDAPLEIISGFANGVSGEVTYDPAKPSDLRGTLRIDARSLSVGNPVMQEHLHSEGWLDVASFPEITFEITRFDPETTSAGSVSGKVTGRMSLHGVSKELTVPVTLTHLPNKLGARLGKPELPGDLLVVRSDFSLQRSDFGIKPGQMTDKVGEDIAIALRVVGASAN